MAYGHAERNLATIRQLEADLSKMIGMRAGLAEPVEVTGTRENEKQGESRDG